ncbi:hypothetical protein EJB05_48408, partial [Eragrostis curvula]
FPVRSTSNRPNNPLQTGELTAPSRIVVSVRQDGALAPARRGGDQAEGHRGCNLSTKDATATICSFPLADERRSGRTVTAEDKKARNEREFSSRRGVAWIRTDLMYTGFMPVENAES